MKVNKNELAILNENGWQKESYVDDFYGKVDQYCLNINGVCWTLTKSRELVEELIDEYNGGSRVCIMTPRNYMAKWVLQNLCDDGIWLCSKLEEAISYVEEDMEEE